MTFLCNFTQCPGGVVDTILRVIPEFGVHFLFYVFRFQKKKVHSTSIHQIQKMVLLRESRTRPLVARDKCSNSAGQYCWAKLAGSQHIYDGQDSICI